MPGAKMEQLAAYLEEKPFFDQCRFDFFMGDATVMPAGISKGHDQWIINRTEYPAFFYFERITNETAELIPVWVTTWLNDHDLQHRSGLAFPTVTTETLAERDAELVNLELTVEFREDIKIGPDENGPIDYNGKQYKVISHFDSDTAESIGKVNGGLHD